MAVMKPLYVTECDACIMCDIHEKGNMYEGCNFIKVRCDNGCDESIMCDRSDKSIKHDGCNVIMMRFEDSCDESIICDRV